MQKFYISSVFLLLLFVGQQQHNVQAASEPVCTYRNSEDETIFLTYLPRLRRGEDYVDFGKDGKCLKRAVCTDTFKTDIEECAKYKVSCVNKHRFTGVFPGCCVKCS